MHHKIDDQYLHQEIPEIEEKYISHLPKEEDLHHEFSASFEKDMRELIHGERKKSEGHLTSFKPRRTVSVAMITVILLIGLASTAFAIESSRQAIFKFVTTTYREFTSILVYEETPASIPEGESVPWKPLEPKYIPKGFKEVARTEVDILLEITYQDAQGRKILYATYPLGAEGILLDTEGTRLYEKKIAGRTVSYFEKHGQTCIFWHDERTNYDLSSKVDQEDLFAMVQSILEQPGSR